MPARQVQFTPAASATFQGTSLPTPITLPAVDGGNPAVVLENLGPGEMAVVAGPVNVGSAVAIKPGAIRLSEGQMVMLPSDPAFSTNTVATIQGGGRLIVTRGALTPVWLFPAPATAVI